MATGGNTVARRLIALLLALPVTLVASDFDAMAQGDSEATQLLKKGLEQWRAGERAEGLATLKKAVALSPSNEEILAALSRADYSALLGELVTGGDTGKMARLILKLAAPILPDRKFDEKEMERDIKVAVEAEDFGDRFEAQMAVARKYGEFAVPLLLKYLESANTDYKVAAHVTLMNRIGRGATLPLNEALQGGNAGVVRFVAAELKTIGDERSLAAMAEAAESNADAAAALVALVAKFPNASGKGAAELYLDLAKLYYDGTYRVKSFSDRPIVIWKWSGDDLTRVSVPRHLYMLKLAEEAAYDSLRLDPSSSGARALLVRILLSEHTAATAVAVLDEADEISKAAAVMLAKVPGTVGAMGWNTLAQALTDSLDGGDHGVAVGVLGIMPSVYASTNATADNPVVRATASSSNAVRLAAAEAILRFNARRRLTAFPDPDGFLGLVAEAVGEIIPRQILVIDAVDARRNRILTELQGQKYVVFDAQNGTDGHVRAVRFAGLDMIVINHDLPDMDIREALGRFAADERTANVPILLVATPDQAADVEFVAQFDGKAVVGSVPDRGLPAEAFVKLVADSFKGSGPDVQARYMVSASILDALAETDADNTLFNWSSLTATLTAVIAGGSEVPDDPPVRANAIRALGNLGDTSAVEPLASFFGASDKALLKSLAALAIAQLGQEGAVTISADGFKALLKGTLSDGEGEGGEGALVSEAAFAALGSLSLSEDQALEVTMANRPK